MNTTEDRLRAATRAAADTVADHSQPPLRLPAKSASYGQPRRRIAGPRLIGSVATATAIVAIAATLVVVRGLATGHQSPAGGGPGTTVPPYFIATIDTNDLLSHSDAVIARTATGKILATVHPPKPFNSFAAVSAASDDRTFVLAAQQRPHPPAHRPIADDGPVQLYLLRLHPGRRPATTLTALPIPEILGTTDPMGLALSPSGTRLAVTFHSATSHGKSYLQVFNLVDHKSKYWTLPPAAGPASPGDTTLSWVGGDSDLAVLIYSAAPKGCGAGCVQLLDTNYGGGVASIVSQSRTIFSTAEIHRYAAWTSALVSTDGSRMLLAGMAGNPGGTGVSALTNPLLYTIAVPSGRILSHRNGPGGERFLPLWAGAGAKVAVIGHPNNTGSVSAAIYRQHRQTPLRVPAAMIAGSW